MLNRSFQRELEKGLPSSLYYIWSGEECFLDDIRLSVMDRVLGEAERDFNLDIFDPSADINAVIDAVNTLPFAAPRRLVIIRDFDRLKADQVRAILRSFDGIPPTTCAVVLAGKAPKAAWKAGWSVFPVNIHDREIPAWLKAAASKKGIRLSTDAVNYLIENIGFEPGMLLAELDKIVTAGIKSVTARDLAGDTGMMREFTPFELVDALIAGNKGRVFRILNEIFSRNAMEAVSIIGVLNWHFRQFYLLWRGKGRRLPRMNERTFRSLSKHLNRYREEDFGRIFSFLHDADVGVKSSGRPDLVVDLLMLRLLQKRTSI